MSRRARRDKRAPIPDFDDQQPRKSGLFYACRKEHLCQRHAACPQCRAAGVTRGPLSALAWISRSREWAWVDALHQPSRDVLELHLPELGIRSRRRHADG